MDVREKLVELANDVLRYLPWGEIQKDTAERIADRMMDNGVTVQEWIPVTERLPEEEGWYLVYTTPKREDKSINKAMFCKGYEWRDPDPYWRGAGGHWANVTHWMELPKPPKGE